MPNCRRIKPTKSKVCTGDLNKKVTIALRTKQPTDLNSLDSLITTTVFAEVWAMQESRTGTATFDASNTDAVFTDIFYIRYLEGVDLTKSIQYNNINYKIVNVEDLNGNREFLKIQTNRTGRSDIQANLV